ncbi:MAG: hypothetical protein ABI480_18465 [Chitinophagaceae bacterium]
MKKIVLTMLSASFVALLSCQHDPVAPPSDPVAARILGKWKVLRYEGDYYQPMNVLIDHDEYLGLPEDSVVFKSDHTIKSYSAFGEEEFPYVLINDSTITMDDEPYKIRKLTATEFNLYAEETDPSTNQRYVDKIFLYR